MRLILTRGITPIANISKRQIIASSTTPFNKNIQTQYRTMSSTNLSPEQTTLVESIREIFGGNATKERLALWTDDAVFEDPLTIAEGRKQYEAQMYGLKAAFSAIEQISSEVSDAGNPIKIKQVQKYTMKGIGKETTINSIIEIHTTPDGSRITKLNDMWDGQLPDSSITTAFRRLNAKTVPGFVSVPKEREGPAGNH